MRHYRSKIHQAGNDAYSGISPDDAPLDYVLNAQ